MKRVMTIIALMLAVAGMAQAQAAPDQDEDEEVYMVVEESPEYPGGMEAMYQYLAANIKWPDGSDRSCEGKVFVVFNVEKNGQVSNIRVLRDPCPGHGLGEEAVRVVSRMPRWKPGCHRGKPVRVQFVLPIQFSLQ